MEQTAMRVSKTSILVNTLLSLLKLAAGILASSEAMVSDAVHSASDVFSTFVVIIGIRMAGKKADKEHPYGHERMECVAAILLSAVLTVTGAGIGFSGLRKIVSGSVEEIAVPGVLAMAAAVLSVIVKEWMFWYTRRNAKKVNSGALMADAWHHRSDSLSSVGAFIGIIGARLGFPMMDPLASVIICLFIFQAAYEIFKDAIDKMVDKSCDDETEQKIRALTLRQQGVMRVDALHTREFGNKIYVDLEIAADGHLSLNESHEIAENVHDEIEKAFPLIKHIMIHVNPYMNRKMVYNLLGEVDKADLEEVYEMIQQFIENKKRGK
ncbi:MAG: cation transporter [Ruminococcus sp.]|nr:cation transporter [Ruminococcus sp.]